MDDIYASQLDSDFAGYLKDSLPCNGGHQSRGSVQSWGSAIVKVYSSNSWDMVDYDSRFIQPPAAAQADDFEIIFKPESDGSACLKALGKLGVTKQLHAIESAPGFAPYGATAVLNEPIPVNVGKVKKLACVQSAAKFN